MEPELKRGSDDLRESITGIRTPITGIRVPIRLSEICEENMTWEIQYKKLDNYIKYVAGQVAPGLQSPALGADDLYQEGLILLYNCFEKYKLKSEKEFQAIFKSSCWRLLRGFCYKKKEVVTVDLDDVYNAGCDDNTLNDLYQEYRLQQVYDLMKGCPDAVKILKEFVEPSEKTFWEATMDYNRKSFLKQQGKSVSVPSSVKIKPAFIKKSLGMTDKQFKEGFKVVQKSVYRVYSYEYDIKAYDDTDEYMTDEEFMNYCGSFMKTLQSIQTA